MCKGDPASISCAALCAVVDLSRPREAATEAAGGRVAASRATASTTLLAALIPAPCLPVVAQQKEGDRGVGTFDSGLESREVMINYFQFLIPLP
jgi:hypothetical protein